MHWFGPLWVWMDVSMFIGHSSIVKNPVLHLGLPTTTTTSTTIRELVRDGIVRGLSSRFECNFSGDDELDQVHSRKKDDC